ncbi:transcription factor TFIIIB subunit brf1 [Didymella pomorum]|uniref:Transcription factor TFIIIB subunit brf1 n=1 Tax=Didymella pomorum TaxID=749634 RepID=A0A9W8ZNA4_9PLEO|nr:transcription factor TFIIIB subunit brf1 [Didymella pomorum]
MPAAVARPKAPRLGSINPSKAAGTGYIYQSAETKRKAQPAPVRASKPERPKCCDDPNISDADEGGAICYNCGQVIEESHIVAEITFGETSGGAAIVEGGFIGENQRHANSMGGTMRGLGGMGSREQAEMNGRSEIQKLAHALKIRQAVEDQAIGWYKLASNHNFVQGRRVRNVAAVALYMAARRQPENTLMLMDLAEKVQVNVWQLGDTYKQFLKKLREEDPAQLIGNKAVQEIEPLMLKYCRKLEFDEASHKVADDACKLLKRMSRDWMIQGRQPAGLCGACIILAARMNNFRRSVREVVYVVKVADSTVNARLYEYKRTPSSALTVNQFREFGDKMKVQTLPPAIWRRAEKEENLAKRKEKQAALAEGITAEELEEMDTAVEAGPSTAPTRASKRRKTNDRASQDAPAQLQTPDPTQHTPQEVVDIDALNEGNEEGLVDAIGSAFAGTNGDDPLDENYVMPKKRGRPPKKREPIQISPEDLDIEEEIEKEITEEVQQWEKVFADFADNDNHEVLKRTGLTAKELADTLTPNRNISTLPDIGEDEFEDDPDVANCILNPAEVKLKERVWLTQNEDWLREQQAKLLAAELEAALDKPKKPKQKRKHHQMGDGSVLEGQPAASAADAAHKMLKKRAKGFSNHINYDRLKELFPGGNTDAASTPSGSGLGASPAPSQSAATPAAAPIAVPEDDEEEYEEEEQEEEDLDEEHQYMEDEEEGFGDNYNDDY